MPQGLVEPGVAVPVLPVNLESRLDLIWLGVWPAQLWVMLVLLLGPEGPVVSLVSWQPLASSSGSLILFRVYKAVISWLPHSFCID